mgnify:CR=1 FL=1
MDELNEQRQQRIKKLDQLRQAGVAPYGSRFDVKDRAGQLIMLHGQKTKEVLEQEKISCTIAGRVVALRRFGKAGFAVLQALHALTFAAAYQLWPQTDLIVAFGTRLEVPTMRWGKLPAGLKLARIDIDPAEMRRFNARLMREHGLQSHKRRRFRVVTTDSKHAHPVAGNGQAMDETTSKKASADLAAYVRTLAKGRGRNIALSEEAVTQSRAFTDGEAHSASPPLVDVVARDLPDLLNQLDGRSDHGGREGSPRVRDEGSGGDRLVLAGRGCSG